MWEDPWRELDAQYRQKRHQQQQQAVPQQGPAKSTESLADSLAAALQVRFTLRQPHVQGMQGGENMLIRKNGWL